MAINNKKNKSGLKLMFLLILMLSLGSNMINVGNSIQNEEISTPKTSDVELIDKVYAFTTSNSSLFFDKSLYFKEFTY